MFDIIYIEDGVADHPRTRRILQRFPHAARVSCTRYTEIFNRKGQNFRVQKRRPGLILAGKQGRKVLPAPPAYGIGGDRNFYFSHMLNCLYDCRYCFLQGMFRSAHMVLFVNYEDFQDEVKATRRLHSDSSVHFFTGYDCDSLALEQVSQFVASFLEFFQTQNTACFELRTKSVAIKPLLEFPALSNCVVAYSLSPPTVANNLENGAPPLARRLDAMSRLAQCGWPLGLRFDPVIYHHDWQRHYGALFDQVFQSIDGAAVHSISLGPFRLPRDFYKNMVRLYPDEQQFAGHVSDDITVATYSQEICAEMLDFCRNRIVRQVGPQVLFPCVDDVALTKHV